MYISTNNYNKFHTAFILKKKLKTDENIELSFPGSLTKESLLNLPEYLIGVGVERRGENFSKRKWGQKLEKQGKEILKNINGGVKILYFW